MSSSFVMLDPAVLGMWMKANFLFAQMGMVKGSSGENVRVEVRRVERPI